MHFHSCLLRMVDDLEIQMKIMDQVQKYKERLGYFASTLATRSIETLDPLVWWGSFGVSTPDLMILAKRTLGLCCTISSCERNWSTFTFIHTKRRNWLEVERLRKLVYINYNKRLHERYQLSKLYSDNYDPIHVDELNFSSESMIDIAGPSNKFVYNEDGLTWVEVEDAMGVTEPVGPSTRSQQQPLLSYSRRGEAPPQQPFLVEEDDETQAPEFGGNED